MANNDSHATKPSPAAVAARAFEIWEREGRQQGRDVDNWLQAEAELTLRAKAHSPVGTENAHTNGKQANGEIKDAKRAPKKKQQAALA